MDIKSIQPNPTLTQQGQQVSSEYTYPPTNTERLYELVQFLMQDVYGKANPLQSEIESAASLKRNMAELARFYKFVDEVSVPVVEKYLRTGKGEPFWNEKTQANEYPQPTIDLIKKSAEQGFSNMFTKNEFGGFGMPESYIGAASLAAFLFPSFYLGEAVGQSCVAAAEYGHEISPEGSFKKELLENIISQAMKGEARLAMFFTERKTGTTLGSNMETFVDENGILNGNKQYITGFSLGGYAKNAYGLLIAGTKDKNGALEQRATFCVVPLYKIDEKGNLLLDEQGNAIKNEGITTARWHKKRGMEHQMLQSHTFENTQVIVIGEMGKGWDVMFKIMNRARAEVGCQLLSHVYDLREQLVMHTSARGLNTNNQQAIIENPEVIRGIKIMDAFIETGLGLITRAGINLDIINKKIENPTAQEQKIQEVARLKAALEPSMIKDYLTRKGSEIIDRSVHFGGADKYTSFEHNDKTPGGVPEDISSKRFEYIRTNSEPAQFYEGTNEAQRKQVVLARIEGISQIDRLSKFQEESTLALRADKGSDKELKTIVAQANKDLGKAIEWVKEQQANASNAINNKMGKNAKQYGNMILAASEDFVDILGAVYMGREALNIIKAAEVAKTKTTDQDKLDFYDQRIMNATNAIYQFTARRPSVENMKHSASMAEPTKESKEVVEALLLRLFPDSPRAQKIAKTNDLARAA